MASAGSSLTSSGLTGFALINATLSTSVSAGALTISVKLLDGSDPSPTTPAYVAVPAATGELTTIILAAPLSVTIPTGINGTMGAVASAPLKIWVEAFNVSGVLSLGVKNCYGAFHVWPLAECSVGTTTAIGSVLTADGAFYTTSTIASASPYRVLGYIEWTAGPATPGTWTAPTRVRISGGGVKLPGMIVQDYYESYSNATTMTTTVPLDDTIPDFAAEGTAYFVTSTQIVLESLANVVEFDVELNVSHSVDATIIGTIYIKATQAAIACGYVDCKAGKVAQLRIRHRMQGNATIDSFVVQVGPSAAGTLTINGIGGTRQLGGKLYSSSKIQEIAA